jgi:hypothetical protein
MALKDVSQGNFFKLNGMEKGQTFKCYPVRVIDVTIEGRPSKNVLVINAETNEEQTIGTPGNIKYLVNDGKLNMGEYTEITRGEDKKYGKLTGSSFTVAQDSERTLSDVQFDAIPKANLAAAAPTKKSASDVKAAAERLKNQVG